MSSLSQFPNLKHQVYCHIVSVSIFLKILTSVLFSILENKLIGYANDSTLIAVVPSPGVRVTVAESLSSDLVKVSEWCDLWGMKLNYSKTKTMIVSRSLTMHPQSPALTIGGTVLKEPDDLVILGVSFDSKMAFEKHLNSLCFQSSFSTAWCLEEILASITL